MKGKNCKPVASGMGMIPKATAMNPHAKGGDGMMGLPGGMGGQHLKHGANSDDCPMLSKLD